MAKEIGLNEEYVNEVIAEFNADAANVLEELTAKFNGVLKALADNWGTNDAVKHVTDNVVPAFQKTGQQVADMIKQIGTTVKTTAEKQAADTNNSMSVNAPSVGQLGALNNVMKEKLDNGYIGVYEDLEKDVATAQEKLEKEVIEKLEKLKNKVVDKCKVAFKDDGSSVANAADGFIAEVKAALQQGFATVKTDIDGLTQSATQYARDIQAAGLRGGSSN